jgi:glycyl-tRNA synthetase beta chain
VSAAHFEKAFLEVPQECLMLTMRQNQKYFPLVDGQGKLLNRFLIVSNMALAHPRGIVHGNERVLRARLADAKFFYDQDRRTALASRVPGLANVVFHNRLGSQLERVGRIESLAALIARELGADETLARRAAHLCKADLLTGMVGEFPELQGIMGMHYARHDGEPGPVAAAIEAHYRPRFAGDALPEDRIGAAVALADKLDALVGLFGIGQQPTGDKDPFGLRRQALGVARILVERALPLALPELVSGAFAAYPRGALGAAHAEVATFVLERLRGSLRDAGYSANEVESVLSLAPARLDLVPQQLAAVRAFAGLPEAESLAAANKRVANILRQAAAKGESFQQVEAKMLREPGERALFDALRSAAREATPRFERGDFTGYLKTLAVLKSPVDAFFDSVMVMVEDPALRQNRLALLADLRQAMNRVADLSKLAA